MNNQNLVLAASSFLSSPLIKKYPDEVKHKFLKHKGLNSDEIKKAFANAGKSSTQLQKEDICVLMDQNLQDHGYIKNNLMPSKQPVTAVFMTVVSSAALGIVVYIMKLIKWYCWPWIMYHLNIMKNCRDKIPLSKKSVEQEHSLLEMNHLKSQIETIKSSLDHQQRKIIQISSDNTSAFKELEKEITSIKKMILSKDSFPLPNKSSIPSWQIKRHFPNDNNTIMAETNHISETQCEVKTVESFEEISPPNKTNVTNNTGVELSLDISPLGDGNTESSHETTE